ncbi:MAG: M23 family metallopeptidase [Myxococcales bacterium]|nr:M23 family metallopeptidase [Myxococcales bacterium]
MKPFASLLSLVVLCALIVSLQPIHAQQTPWNRRLRTEVVLSDRPATRAAARLGSLDAQELRRLGLRPRGAGLLDLSHWPDEPPSPATVLPDELAAAMAELCPAETNSEDLAVYARAIVRYSRDFGVDPWLMAALVYTQSACSAQLNSSYGTGLTLINTGMHREHVRNGVYRFGVYAREGWHRKELVVDAFRFNRRALADPNANLYFAAAFLSVFSQQCPQIDQAFDSAPHRHFVSHFVWGDKVGDTGPEDRVLTARRRLLKSHAETSRRSRTLSGISFVSPLDGFPRIATSGLGEPRDNGRRLHRGIDFASETGEPVRAVASGFVRFAGVDWERRAHIALEPWGALLVHDRHMGPRGLFVEVDHGGGVVSLYAHLKSYDVHVGQEIETGQQLGVVGQTGVRDSGAHLHFGLFKDGEVLDPLDHLAAYVFPPTLTRRGQANLTRPTKMRRATTRQRHRHHRH